MKDLNPWWDALAPADRDLFLEHRNTSPLPVDVVQRFQTTGQLIAGAKWEEQPDYAFNWPSWVQEFLRKKAGDEPD